MTFEKNIIVGVTPVNKVKRLIMEDNKQIIVPCGVYLHTNKEEERLREELKKMANNFYSYEYGMKSNRKSRRDRKFRPNKKKMR